MERRLPRRSTLVKTGILSVLLILYFDFYEKTASEAKAKSTLVAHPDIHYTITQSNVNAPNTRKINGYSPANAAINTAKLLMPALRQRSLASREVKNISGTPEELLDHFFESPQDFLNPIPTALLQDTGRDMTTEECPFVFGSLACAHPQPIPKDKAINRFLESDFTKDECLKLWGHIICDPIFILDELLQNYIESEEEEEEEHPTINPRLGSNAKDDTRYIPQYKKPLLDDLLWDDDLGRDMTMQDCLKLWEPVMCEYYFKYVEEHGRSEYDCSCDSHFTKRSKYSPSCCRKKPMPALEPISHTTKKFEAVKHLEIPRWENSTISNSSACQSSDHYKFTQTNIDERVHRNCSIDESHVIRTMIDTLLPPKDCRGYKPRGSREFKRCLEVSGDISEEAVVVYIVLGVISASLLGLLLLVCVRRRRRSMLPLHQDRNPLSGAPVPKNYGEIRSIESGFDGYSRRYDDTMPYHTVGTTLDGANDGWTKWILGRSQNEKRPVPPPRTSAPRIPSLRLPKPTFATVRRASGLEPAAPPLKSRSSKGTSKLLRWGSGI